jgi:hypothetical protein
MSRLDSFIRRTMAQRDCLNEAARLIAEIPGPVLEFGLGNGRTYDHLRALLPEREIFVFDRQIAAHSDCVPDPAHMVLGDIHETVRRAPERILARAALAHCDIGTGDKIASAALAAWLAPALRPLLAPGAVVVCDQESLRCEGFSLLPLPDGVCAGRYFMLRLDTVPAGGSSP